MVRQGVFSVVVIFVVAAGARADRMAGSAAGATSMGEVYAVGEAGCHEVLLFGLPRQVPTPADPCLHGDCLPQEAPAAADRMADSQGAIVLKDGRGSLDLCLYTLIGLGLFRSGHWVRRSSLGFVPEWHSGGPQPIGYSHAVGPDAGSHAVVCLVQPDAAADRWILHPDRRDSLSGLCRSQSIPTMLACRAPPHLSSVPTTCLLGLGRVVRAIGPKENEL